MSAVSHNWKRGGGADYLHQQRLLNAFDKADTQTIVSMIKEGTVLSAQQEQLFKQLLIKHPLSLLSALDFLGQSLTYPALQTFVYALQESLTENWIPASGFYFTLDVLGFSSVKAACAIYLKGDIPRVKYLHALEGKGRHQFSWITDDSWHLRCGQTITAEDFYSTQPNARIWQQHSDTIQVCDACLQSMSTTAEFATPEGFIDRHFSSLFYERTNAFIDNVLASKTLATSQSLHQYKEKDLLNVTSLLCSQDNEKAFCRFIDKEERWAKLPLTSGHKQTILDLTQQDWHKAIEFLWHNSKPSYSLSPDEQDQADKMVLETFLKLLLKSSK